MNYAYACIGPDDEPRLRDEHAFLERQMAEVIKLERAGDLKGSQLIWNIFARELEQHMQYEENLLFPAFAANGEVDAALIHRLRAEHMRLRSLCRALSDSGMHPADRGDQLAELARAIQSHTRGEQTTLFPWLNSLRRAKSAWSKLRLSAPQHQLSEGG